MDKERIFPLESLADLHAMRSVGSTTRTIYVVKVPDGFRITDEAEEGAVTRWMRYGCTSLRPMTPLVEVQ